MMGWFKMKRIDFLLFLSLFLIIIFTQFYHPVNGLADDQIGLVVAEKVIQNITPLEGYKDLMERYIETGGLHPCTAMGIPLINPIYTLVTHSYSSIIGLSISKWHFLSVILFVFLLFWAKKLGDFFFGKYGFVFPLLLATNLYVLVVIRNSIILFSLSLSIQFAATYYFLKVHEKYERKIFVLSCLFLFLALGNGSTYSPVTYLYILMIFLALIFWKLLNRLGNFNSRDFKLLDKKHYLFIFLVVPLLSISSYFTNDLFLNVPLGSSFDGFLYFTKSKFPPTEFPTLGDKISGSFLKFKEVFGGTSFREIFGPHITFFPYKTPVLDTTAAILFFLGLLSFSKHFTYKKLVLLFFLIYSSFYLYGVGAARIFIVFVPFLLLISSAGFIFLLDILKALKLKRFIMGLFILVLGLFSAYNVYFFDNYFVVKSNSNLMRGAGVAVIKDYIDAQKGKKILVFMESGYPAWYLADFRQTDFIVNTEKEPEEFRKTIKQMLGTYNNVILIFPTDYGYIGNPGFLGLIAEDFNHRYRFFNDAFPEKTSADKVVYDYQQIPQHYLYRFSQYEQLTKFQSVTFRNSTDQIPLGFNGEIESIRIRGGVEEIKFEGAKEVKVHASPATEVLLNFGRDSLYSFYPNYSDLSFQENLNQKEKLAVGKKFIVEKNNEFAWIEPNLTPDQPPYLLEYLFDFPYPVKKIEIKSDARLFNAKDNKASIKSYMVDNENNFGDYLKKGQRYIFLELKSDNSSTYAPGGEVNVLNSPQWGIGRLSSYTVLKPRKTTRVLISQLFEAQYYLPNLFLANLYNIGNSAFFKFTLDTKSLEKINVVVGTVLSIKKDESQTNPIIVDIIYFPK